MQAVEIIDNTIKEAKINYEHLLILLSVIITILALLYKFLKTHKCNCIYKETFDSGYKQCKKCNKVIKDN